MLASFTNFERETVETEKIIGGSESDRRTLLELHERYLVANGKFDWPAIEPIWSKQPHARLGEIALEALDEAAFERAAAQIEVLVARASSPAG